MNNTWSEPFELHFGLKEPDSVGESSALRDSHAVRTVVDELRSVGIASDDALPTLHGYGYGADGTAVGLVLTGLGTLFLSGKKIEENTDAWIRLGRRFLDAIRHLRAREISVSVSEPSAAAIALSLISDDARAQEIRLISSVIVHVNNASLTREASNTFLEHPDRYYIFTIKAGEERIDVIGISAHGRMIFHNSVSLDKWTYHYLG